MNNLVSAIITTHNRKNLLKCAIDSVFAQTYSPIELIVVDDASDDGTSEICQDSRIKYVYISKEETRGGNYARNLGIKNARGKYVAFLDDDDEWLPTKIEKQVALAEEKQCSLVYCLRTIQHIVDGKVIKTKRENRLKPSGNLYSTIFKHYITNTSCILAEKTLVETVGGFDENLRKWQEYDLMIRMAESTNIYYVDDYLCNYRFDVEDVHRISNDFDRVFETISFFKRKYADRLRFLPIKIRIYFYDMCIGDIYKLAKRTGHKWWLFKLFIPRLLLTVFKKVDNRNIC